MDNQKPLVSIITPTFNRGKLLEKTIQSVLDQTYENIEHIVMDGGSSDNTIEILEKYKDKYNLRWISKKDKGQADASNKGLKMAKGEIIGFCNSDDFYAPGAIAEIVNTFNKNPAVDLVFGNCQELNYQTKKLSTPNFLDPSIFDDITAEDILYGRKWFYQPSIFYSRKIVGKTGLMNINYRFCIENDWWIRMLKNGAKVIYVPKVISIIGMHESRGSVRDGLAAAREGMDFMRHNGVKIPLRMRIHYFRWKYPLLPNFLKIHFPAVFSSLRNAVEKSKYLRPRIILKSIYKKIFSVGSLIYLKRELSGMDSVLDLGCGSNSLLRFFNIPYSVGVDKFGPYLGESKKRKIHNKYIEEDVAKIGFPDKSFDAIIAIDLLEHLTKEEGYRLIKNMEKWARKKIVVFTPNGYVKQAEYDGNRFQQHKCGWIIKELEDLGFKTYGINGFKKLRDSGGSIKYRPKFLWCRISDLTQKIAYYYPKIAFQILAVKEIKNI